MVFGILKDIKEGENRVICTPVEVASIRAAGHTVLVQSGAGVGSGFSDEKYAAAGAEIVAEAAEMWQRCDFLAKVKEITGGDSLDANIQLVFNNVALGAKVAAEVCNRK